MDDSEDDLGWDEPSASLMEYFRALRTEIIEAQKLRVQVGLARRSSSRSDAICCPADPDDTAEAYAFGTLVGTDVVTYEEHLLTCEQCRAAVDAADQYVRGNAPRRKNDYAGSRLLIASDNTK
jgi:hypothetical protein